VLDELEVESAVPASTARTLGLRSWSPARPLRTLLSMAGNRVSQMQAARFDQQVEVARHLIASARKAKV
jgi:hypothetical protein